MQDYGCLGDGLTVAGLESIAVGIATWWNQAGDRGRATDQGARQIAEGPVHSNHRWLRGMTRSRGDNGQNAWQGRKFEDSGDCHQARMRMIIILAIFVVSASHAVPHTELNHPEL